MDSGDKIIEDWYIIFTHSHYDFWLMKWLKKGFQHCYAVKESPGGNFWIVVDTKNCATIVTMQSKEDYPHIRTMCHLTDTVLPVRARIDRNKRLWPLCIFNCVEQVKMLLGMKDCRALTPWQLYRRLTNDK